MPSDIISRNKRVAVVSSILSLFLSKDAATANGNAGVDKNLAAVGAGVLHPVPGIPFLEDGACEVCVFVHSIDRTHRLTTENDVSLNAAVSVLLLFYWNRPS